MNEPIGAQLTRLRAARGQTPAEIKAALPTIAEALKQNPRIARYVPANLTAHLSKACVEQGGQPLPK